MKIILLGNAGSGKTSLARKLIGTSGIAHLSLDEIAWDPGVRRKPKAESVRLLREFVDRHPQWVMEGCYGDLVEAALPFAEELRFLNPGIEVCVRHCRLRPWEKEKFSSPEEQERMLETLIDWVCRYETRGDEFGLKRHRSIYDGFTGPKQEYLSEIDL